MKVTISIKRKKVYALVEGISVIISQKNGGTPTYEQLWASADEAAKLDIYYREAVSDLEKRLMEWLPESNGQYDLEADGTDYTLTLTLHRYWPKRLKGLLANKVQDYLVHSVTAGWLNDFETVTTKQDYLEMAGGDQTDIREILLQKEFGFSEAARASETAKGDEEGSTTAKERKANEDKAAPASVDATAARASETAKGDEEGSTTAKERKREQWKSNSDEAPTGLRSSDREHKGMERRPDTHRRREDDVAFADEEDAIGTGARNRDNARVCTRPDWTDWSGTHYGLHTDADKHTDIVHGRRLMPPYGHHNGYRHDDEERRLADD